MIYLCQTNQPFCHCTNSQMAHSIQHCLDTVTKMSATAKKVLQLRSQVSKLAHNRRFCSEFPFFDMPEPCCEIGVRVREIAAATSLMKKAAATLVPEFSIVAAMAGSDDWQLSTPEILQLF